jgi:hypothetical protein
VRPYAAHEDEVIKSTVVVVHGLLLMGRDVFLEEPERRSEIEPHQLRPFRRRAVARQKIRRSAGRGFGPVPIGCTTHEPPLLSRECCAWC